MEQDCIIYHSSLLGYLQVEIRAAELFCLDKLELQFNYPQQNVRDRTRAKRTKIMSPEDKDACYTYFDCKEVDCLRRTNMSKQCWEIDDVRCQSHSKAFDYIKKQVGSKLEACKLCLYYQNNHS